MDPTGRTTLPLDILLYIIDLLAGGDGDEDVKSLRILSLACKSMVPLCRKHLFSDLPLAFLPVSIRKRFNDLLSKNPDIACYVRNLNYRVGSRPIVDYELNILDILKKHSSLQSLSLTSSGLGWNQFPELLQSSLVSLIQLPTVAHLDICNLKGFPVTALSCCSNLIDLRLGSLEFSPDANQVILRSKIPTPLSLYIRTDTYDLVILMNSASLHAGGPIVDLSSLKRADFEVESRDDLAQACELIRATTKLEYLNINTWISVNQPVELAGLGASLAINAYRTLKTLELDLTIIGDDHDPLCGLNHELRFIAGNNILEELELYVVVQVGAPSRTESADWSGFDSVLTESDAFPTLNRVLVDIYWCLSSRNPSERAVFESLKEDKFPRLLESKAVEFSFCSTFNNVGGITV